MAAVFDIELHDADEKTQNDSDEDNVIDVEEVGYDNSVFILKLLYPNVQNYKFLFVFSPYIMPLVMYVFHRSVNPQFFFNGSEN